MPTEIDIEAMRAALQLIVDGEEECECEHNNENCCVVVNQFCAYCIAATTLAATPLADAIKEVERLREKVELRREFFSDDKESINYKTLTFVLGEYDEIIRTLEALAPESGDATVVEIIGPDGKVHYRRPWNDPDVQEAFNTLGYSVRKALVPERAEKEK